jgi:Tfp pilus assembly protein PilO
MLFRERQQIVICVVAGVLIGGFILFRYLPLRKRIRTAGEARVAQDIVAGKALTQSGQLPLLREQLSKLQMAVGNYETKIPDHRNLGPFHHGIAELMNRHGLTDQLVRAGREVQGDGLNCIPVNMQCKGRLNQIFEFFKSLQTLDRLVRIEQVRLENSNDFGGRTNMEMKTVICYRTPTGQL